MAEATINLNSHLGSYSTAKTTKRHKVANVWYRPIKESESENK